LITGHKRKIYFQQWGFWLYSGAACYTFRPGIWQIWNFYSLQKFLHQGAGMLRKN